MPAGCGSSADDGTAPRIVDARPDFGWNGILAAEGSTVAVAYGGLSSDTGTYVARSNDGGASFDPAKRVLVDVRGGTPEDLTVAGETIYLTYQVVVDAGRYEVRIARSDDGGQSFTIQGVALGIGPALLVNGATLYLAYNPQAGPEPGAPLFQRSDDGGLTWSAAVVISPTATAGPISVDGLLNRTLSLGSSGGTLYLSFYDASSNTQRIAHSSDSGENWIVETGQDLLATASMVTVGDDLVLPLVDAQNRSFISQSNDHGATWTRHRFDVAGGEYGNNPVGDVFDSTIAGPHLVSNGSKLYAIFNQGSTETRPFAVGFARSDDQGATWPAASVTTPFAQSTSGLFPAERARIVVSPAPVPALLISIFDGTHLRVLRSTDDGATWR